MSSVTTIDRKVAIFPSGHIYICGATLKEWAERDGTTVTSTTDGRPIVDEELYAVTVDGIFEVE